MQEIGNQASKLQLLYDYTLPVYNTGSLISDQTTAVPCSLITTVLGFFRKDYKRPRKNRVDLPEYTEIIPIENKTETCSKR